MGIASDLPYIPFREAHGMNRVDISTREWNGVIAHYHEKHQGPGKVWGDVLGVELPGSAARGGTIPDLRYGFPLTIGSGDFPKRPTSFERYDLPSMPHTSLISWRMSLILPSLKILYFSYTIRASHSAPISFPEPALNRSMEIVFMGKAS
jgi:hypothetical protein